MGTGSSGNYGNTKGATNSQSQNNAFSRNVQTASQKYRLTQSGYFGNKGKNSRVIESKNPVATSKDFYSLLSKGGKKSKLANGKGVQTVFPDGTRIVYRVKTSTPNSPAVDISVSIVSLVKRQKIHFVKED